MNPFNLILVVLGLAKKSDAPQVPLPDGSLPTPPPVPAWVESAKWVIRLATLVGVILLCFIKWHKTGEVPTEIPFSFKAAPDAPTNAEAEQDTPAPVVKRFGWSNDPEARAESFAEHPPLNFAETPAGKVKRGADQDVYLWRFVRKASGKKDTEDWYPNVNQNPVGCCVGCGFKHALDVVQAEQVCTDGGEFKPLSVEVIYGISRVDIGGGRLRGDGSVGAWAARGVEDYGVVAMAKYAGGDLTTFDPMRARQYGSRGVPGDIKAEAKKHPVQTTALVRSWDEVAKAISQGYPVAVCSDVGFDDRNGQPGTRDKDGFIPARGTWPHCMCFIGIRGGSRPGAFCLNSWGDDMHRGPRFPADAPSAGFWVDKATVDRMVRQGDNYSLSDLKGFEARNLDWLAHARPETEPRERFDARRDRFRLADPLASLALAP